MSSSLTVCVVQVERQVDLRHTVHRAGGVLLGASTESPDFALIGGEYALNESRFHDPYPPLIDLAQSFQSNVVAAVDALTRRFGEDAANHPYESMHLFTREGTAALIQDKHYSYSDNAIVQIPIPEGNPAGGARVAEVDGVKVGLVRGLDLLHPAYTTQLAEAEVLFVATVAIDDVVIETARVRAYENQCYIVLASFVGQMLGRDLNGVGAIIAPVFDRPGLPSSSDVLEYLRGPGLIETELDLDYIRHLKAERPFEH